MNARTHRVLAIAGAAITLIVGGGLLILPQGRRARDMRESFDQLRSSAMASASVTKRLEGLAHELERLRSQRADLERTIPDLPQVEGVMDELARAVDGEVFGQTVRPATVARALPGSRLSEQAMLLQIDLDASPDSIFTLLRTVESMDRLVRVASLRVEADRLDGGDTPSMLTTTIGLEFVFDPPPAREGL